MFKAHLVYSVETRYVEKQTNYNSILSAFLTLVSSLKLLDRKKDKKLMSPLKSRLKKSLLVLYFFENARTIFFDVDFSTFGNTISYQTFYTQNFHRALPLCWCSSLNVSIGVGKPFNSFFKSYQRFLK